MSTQLPDELLEELGEVQEEQLAPPQSSRLVLWLAVFGVAMLFVPIFLVSTTVKSDNADLQDQINQIKSTVEGTRKPSAEEQSLRATITQIGKEIATLQPLNATLAASHVDWPTIMQVVSDYDSSKITLTGLAQTNMELDIAGTAPDEVDVLSYSQNLRSSNQFRVVRIQSLTLQLLPTPTINPNAAGQVALLHNKFVIFSLALEIKPASTATVQSGSKP